MNGPLSRTLLALAAAALALAGCKGDIDEAPAPADPSTPSSGAPATPGTPSSPGAVPTPPSAVDPAAPGAATSEALPQVELPPGAKRVDIRHPESECGALDACERICSTCTEGACTPEAAEACRHVGNMALRGQTIELGTAATAYESACQGGNGVACSALGNLVHDGRGRAPDTAAGRQLWKRGCELGAGVGCFNIATSLPPAEAAPWFEKADAAYTAQCEVGDDLGWCMNHGVLFEHGYGRPADTDRAREIYAAACSKDHANSCTNLALMKIQAEGRAEDALEAARGELQAACFEMGSGLACGALGQMLALGLHGFDADRPQGRVLLQGACMAGERQPCATLAALLFEGKALPQDTESATAFLGRACDLGDRSSCYLLGMQYLPGPEGESMVEGVPPDATQATQWLSRACWIGDGEACMRAAAVFELGTGDVEAEPGRSLPLLNRGCGLFFGSACMALMDKDEPLPLTDEQARLFYMQACRQGFGPACEKSPVKPLDALPGGAAGEPGAPPAAMPGTSPGEGVSPGTAPGGDTTPPSTPPATTAPDGAGDE